MLSCDRRITEQNDSEAAVMDQSRISRSRIAETRAETNYRTDGTQTIHRQRTDGLSVQPLEHDVFRTAIIDVESLAKQLSMLGAGDVALRLP